MEAWVIVSIVILSLLGNVLLLMLWLCERDMIAHHAGWESLYRKRWDAAEKRAVAAEKRAVAAEVKLARVKAALKDEEDSDD